MAHPTRLLRNFHPHAHALPPSHSLHRFLPRSSSAVPVRCSHPSELDHLVSCLSSLYELKAHRDRPHNTYLGYTIDYSPTSPSPCMTLSMPNYVPAIAMFSRLSGCGSVSSPAVYTPPIPYPDLSIPTTPSTSTLVSHAEKTWIQQVVGSLLLFLRESVRPFCPHCRLPTFIPPINPTPPNTISPLLTAFSTMSPPTATPKKPSTPPS